MKKTIALALAITVSPTLALADPTVFGLELGKTTVDEFTQQYAGMVPDGYNRFSGGVQYVLGPDVIKLGGLKRAIIIFDTNNVLAGVAATVDKNRFYDLHAMLGDKYQLISQHTPRLGNRIAKFRDGKTVITLDAPHMSFDMQMNYIRDSLQTLHQKILETEAQEKAQSEANML